MTLAIVIGHLTPLRRRLQWQDSLKAAWLSVGLGLALTAALLIAGRLRPLLPRGQLLLIGLSVTLFVAALGQLVAWLRPVSAARLARLGDARLRLDERLITALELAEGRLQTSPALRQAQLNDALERLARASLQQAFPLAKRNRLLSVSGLLLAVVVAVAALTLAPNPQERILAQRAELVDLLDTQIAELEQIQADLLAEPDPLAAAKIEEISESLAGLIDRLHAARADLSPEQALAALSEAEQTLTQLDTERRAQQDALNALADALAQSDLSAAQQAAEALQNGDAGQAAAAFQQLGANPPAGAGANALAGALQQAAGTLSQTDPELAQSLQQAAEALQSGDAQSIRQALRQAAEQLEQAGAQAEAQAQAAQALQNIQQARQALAAGQGQEAGAQRQLVQGQGGGSGSGREDPGPGAEGLYSAQGTNGIISTDNGPNQNRLEEYNSVFAPNHLGGQGGPFAVPPPQGSDGGIDIGETPPNPNRDPGAATVPYTEVFGEYRDRASTALDSDYIPLGMKDYIRQYFGALEPK
ncbi:MAG: hypothetical protein ACE5G8_10350 [Anaerolineae bacterium]